MYVIPKIFPNVLVLLYSLHSICKSVFSWFHLEEVFSHTTCHFLEGNSIKKSLYSFFMLKTKVKYRNQSILSTVFLPPFHSTKNWKSVPWYCNIFHMFPLVFFLRVYLLYQSFQWSKVSFAMLYFQEQTSLHLWFESVRKIV